ncbi:MAG: riboflavin synthase [Pirellulaceae bacterium]|nr:riboflavin synthase [Pirellulaceae bacterium]
MFTGLVEAQTSVLEILPEPAGKRLIVARPPDFDDCRLGDSISVSGCCLTIVDLDDQRLVFQAGEETLSRTTLGRLTQGSRLNLERAMRLGDRIGGHLVSGHIDGVGTVTSRADDDEWSKIFFSASPALMRQMVTKGSICVDGVSLTLVDVNHSEFSVALIPHTLEVTTLGQLRAGDEVHLETDLLAKYVQRQLEFDRPDLDGQAVDRQATQSAQATRSAQATQAAAISQDSQG